MLEYLYNINSFILHDMMYISLLVDPINFLIHLSSKLNKLPHTTLFSRQTEGKNQRHKTGRKILDQPFVRYKETFKFLRPSQQFFIINIYFTFLYFLIFFEWLDIYHTVVKSINSLFPHHIELNKF